jgi:hypothetical protein
LGVRRGWTTGEVQILAAVGVNNPRSSVVRPTVDGLNVEVSLFADKRRFIFMMILSKIFNPAKYLL